MAYDSIRFPVKLARVESFYVHMTAIRFGASQGVPSVVSMISPTAGSNIDPTNSLVVDVTDPGGVKSVIITARFPLSKRNEVIFEDGAFDEQYSASSRVAISNGYRYTLLRRGGWLPGEVDLKVRAFDNEGHET